MCNACRFRCCAYDGFSKCGCDDCDNPECWDPETYADEFGDDGDEDDLGYDYQDAHPVVQAMAARPFEPGLGCPCARCQQPKPTPAPQTPQEAARLNARAAEARKAWRAALGQPETAGRGHG